MIGSAARPDTRREPPAAENELPAGPPPGQARRVAAPGRDLFLFLLLLLAIDMSSVLHIYSLSQLYGEHLFAGMGLILALFALLMLILPDRGRPEWLRLPFRHARAVAALYAVVCLAAAGATLLVLALWNPPEWYPVDPDAPVDPAAPLWGLLYLLAAVIGAPLLALFAGYTRNEHLRRAILALLACAWFVLSVVNLMLMTGTGNGWAPNTWAALLGSGWPVAAGAAGLLLAAGLLTFAGPRIFMLAALGAGMALRLIGTAAIPISPALGDMLPLVQMATARLTAGQDPYVVYQLPWDLPLTYWPLTILTYTPFTALHLDIRWANLLLGPLMLALLWRPAAHRPAAAYAFGLLYLTPAMLQWDLTTAAPPFWTWLAIALAATAARPPLPGLAIGLALAAGPLALPFAPFLFARWLQGGVLRAALNGAGAAAALLLLVGPFMLVNFAGFWQGAVAWFNDVDQLPRLKWVTDRTWLLEPGLAGQFWLNGMEAWLKPLQFALLAGLSLLALRKPLTPAAALRWGAAGYLLFMIFNPVIWPYLYVPVLLGMVFVLRWSDQDTSFDGWRGIRPMLH